MRKPGQGSNGPGPKVQTSATWTWCESSLRAGANLNARVTKRPGVGTTALNLIGGTPFSWRRAPPISSDRLLAELSAMAGEDRTHATMAAAGAGILQARMPAANPKQSKR